MSSITEHWAAFDLRDPRTTLQHPAFNDALQKLRRILATQDDTWLAQLVASTSGGKSHAVTVIHGEILDSHAEEMKADSTFMPSVYVSMNLLSDHARHNWSDDYSKILGALKHPNPSGKDLSEARKAIKKALTFRRTKLLILDEAAHFISGCNPNDLEAIKRRANVVKSLTEDTQTRLLLSATYDLLPMIRVDGQLARRNQLVHLARYRNTPFDRAVFLKLLNHIDERFSDHLGVSLSAKDEEIYRGCIGLVGSLRNWLVRASTAAEQDGRREINDSDLKSTRSPLGDLMPMLEEAVNGEEKLCDTPELREDFDSLLEKDKTAERPGLDRPIEKKPTGEKSPSTAADESRKKKRGKKAPPGRPNPKRNRLEDDEQHEAA